jgi:hypothetical protein
MAIGVRASLTLKQARTRLVTDLRRASVTILGVLFLAMMSQGAVILTTVYFELRILKVRKPARCIAVLLSWGHGMLLR